MSKGLSEKILFGIKENSNNDRVVINFLKNILYEEVEHAGGRWWKSTYREMIKKSSEEWSGINED